MPATLAATILKSAGAVARRVPPFRGKCRAGRTVAGVLLGHRPDGRLLTAMADGSRLLLDPRSRTEAGPFFDGSYDTDDLDFFRACLPPGGVAIDIGANVGLIAVPLGLALKPTGGRLLVFEPVAANLAALKDNLRLNGLDDGVATVFPCAFSDAPGTMRIAREAGNGAATGNAFLECATTGATGPLEWSEVPLERLDDVLDRHPLDRIDLIKIDVEGFELQVLRGARQTVACFRPIVYGEFNFALRAPGSGTFADVADILTGLDYLPLAFTGRLELVRVKYEPGRGNAVLCPAERADSLIEHCRRHRDGRVPSVVSSRAQSAVPTVASV